MVSNRYNEGIMNIVSAISISFLIIKICQIWEKKTAFGTKIFSYIGKNTLLLMSLHMIEGKFISWQNDIPKILIRYGVPANYFMICVIRCLLLSCMLMIVKTFQYYMRKVVNKTIL